MMRIYRHLARAALEAEAQGADAVADAIRDAMDVVWRRLSNAEHAALDALPAVALDALPAVPTVARVVLPATPLKAVGKAI
jgi:hypothetical protein